MSAAPTFSVILVCKNPGRALAAAVASVEHQQDCAAELIVIDGGSTDGTVPWLEARRSNFGMLVSEPDAGIYDAMNKGVGHARGAWVYFLGADDQLASDTVLRDVAAFARTTPAAVLAGEAEFADGRRYAFSPAARWIVRNSLHHQAAFYRRTLFRDHGAFDTSLRIMGDYDFNVRLQQAGVPFASMPLRVARCGSNGVSDSGRWRGYREEITVRHRHFSALRCSVWDVASAARFLRKKSLRLLRTHG